jgi:hypothetical protein
VNHHFFASSVATWATTNDQRDLRDLIKLMDAEKLSYNLYYIPLPHGADYEIRMYQPQVKGALQLEFFEFHNGRKVKKEFA